MAPEVEPEKKKRAPREPKPDIPEALKLEPPPEEMPAIHLVRDDEPDAPKKPRKPKKSKAEGDAAGILDAVAAAGAFEADSLGDELPPTDLMNEVPPRYGDTGKAALDAMGVKLMDAYMIELRIYG